MYHLNIARSFKKFSDTKGLIENHNQKELLKILEELSKNFKTSFLDSIFNKPKYKGFYLYGDVGCGKTTIINFFLDQLKNERVLRTHFNKFMVDIHDRLHKLQNESSSLSKIVKSFKNDFDIIFLDEFQITNIADAMILGKLLENFFKYKIFIITTSNVRPDNLYLGGLQRDQFLPFIKMIKDNTLIYSLDTGQDYRDLYLSKTNRFFSLKDQQGKKKFNEILINVLSNKKFSEKIITVKKRKIIIKNYISDVAKFNYSDLFEMDYGAEDYLELCKITKIIFIENIPNFTDEMINQQYRFINFIDIIYDNNLRLVATAHNQIDKLTSSAKLTKIFSRTLSRLKDLTKVTN